MPGRSLISFSSTVFCAYAPRPASSARRSGACRSPDLADRRIGIRHDLDQIETRLVRNLLCLEDVGDTSIQPLGVDQLDLANLDVAIDAWPILLRDRGGFHRTANGSLLGGAAWVRRRDTAKAPAATKRRGFLVGRSARRREQSSPLRQGPAAWDPTSDLGPQARNRECAPSRTGAFNLSGASRCNSARSGTATGDAAPVPV